MKHDFLNWRRLWSCKHFMLTFNLHKILSFNCSALSCSVDKRETRWVRSASWRDHSPRLLLSSDKDKLKGSWWKKEQHEHQNEQSLAASGLCYEDPSIPTSVELVLLPFLWWEYCRGLSSITRLPHFHNICEELNPCQPLRPFVNAAGVSQEVQS